MPDAKTLIRLAQVLDGPARKPLIERLVTMAGERGVGLGRRLRVDTTGVGTTIHYPTDSTLLTDGVRDANRKPVKSRMGTLYRELVGRTGAVVREAEAAARLVPWSPPTRP